MGSGSAGEPAPDQRVSTSKSRTLLSASSTARSKPSSPSGGSGTYSAMSCSCATASWIRLSTSGRAIALGTGVTRPTQCEESPGVSGRTGTMIRRGRPATAAYRCIISTKVSTSGPPMSKPRLTSAGKVAAPTR